MKRHNWLKLTIPLLALAALSLALFPPAGETPVIARPATAEGGDPPMLMLTFDDGPDPRTTEALAQGLAERGAAATFFFLGERAEAYPELTQLTFDSGHQLGSHGWDHSAPFTSLSDDALAAQVDDTARVIEDITGQPPAYVRPPYGAIDIPTAEKIPYPLMLWTIDTRDWEVQDAEEVRDYIVENAADGGVVILHDGFPTTVEAVLEAVDILQSQGWVFPTLAQYYQSIGFTPQPGVVYRGDELAYIYAQQ